MVELMCSIMLVLLLLIMCSSWVCCVVYIDSRVKWLRKLKVGSGLKIEVYIVLKLMELVMMVMYVLLGVSFGVVMLVMWMFLVGFLLYDVRFLNMLMFFWCM